MRPLVLLFALGLLACSDAPNAPLMCRVPLTVTTNDSTVVITAYYEYPKPFQTVCPL